MFGLILGVVILVAGILLMTLSSDKAVEHSVILALALAYLRLCRFNNRVEKSNFAEAYKTWCKLERSRIS